MFNIGKKIIKPLAKPLLLTGSILFGGAMLNKASAQDPSLPDIDPFSAPNVIYTKYTGHGGGNVDQDPEGKIDWDDYNAMDIMPSHTSDIDGDGIPSTDNDKKELADYLNGITHYLRGHWDDLQTESERLDWATKIADIYNVSFRNWNNDPDPLIRYISGNYKTDICVGTVGQSLEGTDYYGDPKIPIFDKYSNKEHNGKGNIPFFGVQRIRNYVGHGMNAILVGDNSLNFDHWAFYEPQTNKFVDPRKDETSGDFVDNEIRIQLFNNLRDVGDGVNETQMTGTPTGIVFHSEQGTGNINYVEQNQNLLLNKPSVGVEDDVSASVPPSFSLDQNYPNPFNPSTQISYKLPKDSKVELSVYNVLGKEVIKLVNESQKIGSYAINWNGENSLGEQVHGGMYFYTLRTKDFTKTNKMLLLR